MKLFFFSFEVSKHLNILVLPLPINLQVSLQFGTEKDLKWQRVKKKKKKLLVGYKKNISKHSLACWKTVLQWSALTLYFIFLFAKKAREVKAI